MISEQDERQIVEGLLRNDRSSLEEVYEALSPIAYGLALRLLGSGSDAEDIVQESFLALWRQAERLDPGRGLRSYLLSIVHHRAVDRLRRRVRRPESTLDPAMSLPAATEDPADVASRQAEREEVRAALEALSLEQRRTVELVYFNGLTTGETAAHMRVPLGTVKSRLRLALRHLRQELGAP